MKRKNLTIRAVFSLGQPLPQNWIKKLELFKHFVKNEIKSVQMAHVGNIDEVVLSFDMPRNYTVSKIGVKDVRILTMGLKSVISLLCYVLQPMVLNIIL